MSNFFTRVFGNEARHAFAISFILLILITLAGCTKESETMEARAREAIAGAFLRITEREPGDFYLTISDKASGKLIQFTGGRGAPLCVGVSELSLNKEEIPRARKLFSDFGVPAISSYPDNDPALAVEIFTGCFGDDYAVGPRLVERFFREVYLLPDDFEVLVEED